MRRICRLIHRDPDPIFIPISGFKGIGLSKKHGSYKWFDGWTPEKKETKCVSIPIKTLEEALEYIPLPERRLDAPFRGGVTKPMIISGVGTVITAYSIQGKLEKTNIISVKPSNVEAEIKSMEMHNEEAKLIYPGESFGMVLKPLVGNHKQIKSGDIISHRDDKPVEQSSGYLCSFVVVDHPTGVKINYTPTFIVFLGSVPGKVAKIIKAVHLKSKTQLDEPALVPKGYKFECIVIPLKPICAETDEVAPMLSRCGLRDGNKLVAVGTIKQCLKCTDLVSMGIKTEIKVEVPVKAADKKKKAGGKKAAAAGG